ncbi:MAG: hypothetical protein WAL98_13570 [Desulfatiglandaceae bacterium]
MKNSRSPALHTRNPVLSQIGTQEQNLRVFFRRFLMGDLAFNPGMDAYLGFTPPGALGSLMAALKPQMGVHPLRSG